MPAETPMFVVSYDFAQKQKKYGFAKTDSVDKNAFFAFQTQIVLRNFSREAMFDKIHFSLPPPPPQKKN